MTRQRSSARPSKPTPVRGVGIVLAGALVALMLSACGGSSKPGYCSAVSNLQKSVKALPQTDVVSNGVSALQSALAKVQTDAKAVVNAAKSDFPTETSNLSSSVDTLKSTIKSLPSSLSASAIAQIGTQAAKVVTSVQALTTATSSKCG